MRASTSPDSRLVINDVKIAMPIVPPTDRAKVIIDVTVPSTSKENAFCTAMTRVGIVNPRPKPTTNMYDDATIRDVLGVIVDRR